jgi:hypothetical protein
MNKSKALAVLHEIFDVCKESVIVNHVSIDLTFQGNYEIKMKCNLDQQSRQCIKPILEKYKLALKEKNGYTIIYSLSLQIRNLL